MLRAGGDPAAPDARHVHLDARRGAGGAHGREVRALVGVVAEDQRPPRARRQGRTRLETIEVDEVQDRLHPLRGHAGSRQTLAGRQVDCHVAQQPWEEQRGFLPGLVAVTDEQPGDPREVEQGRQRPGVVVAVDEVGRLAQRVERVRHRDAAGRELACQLAQHCAVDDGIVAAGPQRQRQLDHVELRAGAMGQRRIGQQDSHRGCPHRALRAAPASGT